MIAGREKRTEKSRAKKVTMLNVVSEIAPRFLLKDRR
jgi:hypothetical protein